MKKIMFALAGISMMSLATVSWASDTKQSDTDRLDKAAQVLTQVMGAPDKGIPQEVLDHAKCIAVVPHMVKGGFVFGAEGGKGVATCRTDRGWSAPAFFAITGGSWGLQIGVEGVDLVMVFQNDQGMKHLLESKFKIGADASAAAGPIGRHASANTDWKMNAEVLTYSRAKGAFAGLTLNGADVRPDEDAMRAEYGGDVTFRSVLTGAVPPPSGAHAFLAAVRNAKSEATASR
jgi:lipid-binding SYLF domain-containing protein